VGAAKTDAVTENAAIATKDLNSISTPYILCSKYILKKAGCFFYKKKERKPVAWRTISKKMPPQA
jgi:hypothetical protein